MISGGDIMSTVMESGMYISLKKEDHIILQNDLEIFRDDKGNKLTLNRLMNTIFLYMANESGAAEAGSSRKSHGGTAGVNIKLNKNIAGIMAKAGPDPTDPLTYSADCAAYYMQFIEPYCSLPLVEREKILYSPMIRALEDNIDLNYYLRITKTDGSIVSMLPFEIKQSDEIHKNYLVGFTLEKRTRGYKYRNTICIPLRKIKKWDRIVRIDTKNGICFGKSSGLGSYKELIGYIRQRYSTDGVLYLSGKLRDVTVRLSDTGLKKLGNFNLFRPAFAADENDGHVIRFRATKLQTFKYFFPFGSDAEILEPSEYRKAFYDAYRAASERYS